MKNRTALAGMVVVIGGALFGWLTPCEPCSARSVSECSTLFEKPEIVALQAIKRDDRKESRRPKVIIILTDDQGYADVGCYGAKNLETPNLDRMAKEGVRFTDFYVAQGVCSASRAALLTGCYPNRIGILGALNPSSTTGISAEEKTIAEVLKPRGYACAVRQVASRIPTQVSAHSARL
ncbi:MAG: sulfatase-like hydrolase/transferase [Gemmataceae bacterium]